MRNGWSRAFLFLAVFCGFLTLIALAGFGAWWYVSSHFARPPLLDRHASMSSGTVMARRTTFSPPIHN
jgi:hypothetical protein